MKKEIKFINKITEMGSRIESDIEPHNLDFSEIIIFSKFILFASYEEILIKRLALYNYKKFTILSLTLKNVLSRLIIDTVLKSFGPDTNLSQEDVENEIYNLFDQREKEYKNEHDKFSKISGSTTIGQILDGIIENKEFFTSISQLFLNNALTDRDTLSRELISTFSDKIKVYMEESISYLDFEILKSKNVFFALWHKIMRFINNIRLK